MVELALAADKNAAYARLSPAEQPGALLCGLLTGTVGVVLASSTASGHDAVMEALVEYLPQAREMAESVSTGGPH